jgi:uncharacterized OB-fold protein
MPIVYRQHCEVCDRQGKPNITYDGFAGAVITSGQSGGTIFSEHYLAYLDSTGSLVTLPHPIEDDALREQGETWFNATIHGRLFQITNLMCRQCGSINCSPRLSCVTSYGCSAGIVLAFVTFILLKQLTPIPPQLLGFVSFIGVFVPDFLLARWLQFRYRKRIAQLAFTQCSKCGSPDAIAVSRCKSETMICSKCQQPTMRISIAGRS